MESDIAIKAGNVSKTFKIPHEKISTIRGAFVNMFRKKTYEEFKALDGVSFEVKKGEFFGIIGRNGSGKSTLLKILAGIYQADRGKVHINGLISPFLELGIGFNPELSGRDNIYLNATVLGMTKKQIDAKFDDIVAFSELERFIDQKLKNYSSGMQVRLAFSVAIHANREILLMDEVLAVGDSNFQNKCLKEFARYKSLGKTVILVTHDIDVAQKYCDRSMLLRNGEVYLIGDSQTVGNEYLYQNMTDEEKRIATDNKEDKDNETDNNDLARSRVGNKKAEILDYKVFDSGNRECLELKSGRKFKIILKVKFNASVSNPTFGIKFSDFTNSIFFGLHSLYSRNPLQIKDIKAGDIFEIIFEDEMILVPGVYCATIACSNQRSFLDWDALDIINNSIKIKVSSDKQFWGMINSNCKISANKINQR